MTGTAAPVLDRSHYTRLAIDPFEYAMQNRLDGLQMSVVKYVTRFREKGGTRDLQAAIVTLQRLIEWEDRVAAQKAAAPLAPPQAPDSAP